ncbi:hypothetical protein [Tropicimonas sp. IMCC34043]|uniref:hypothetical protein n=1 Tax=Tropicimonas sp. IMCC34043 TaxID=2248760 RepID=UPI000E232BFC|nr:hypothetical protein [Tropicimonas sp. IMCC34043]
MFFRSVIATALLAIPGAATAVPLTFTINETFAGFGVFEGNFSVAESFTGSVVTTSDIVGYQMYYGNGSLGSPSGWGVSVKSTSSANNPYFSIRYNLDGALGDDADEFLSFGISGSETCYNDVEGTSSTFPWESSASLTGVYIERVYEEPPYGCSVVVAVADSFPKAVLPVDGMIYTPPPVPLPAGGALLLVPLLGLALLGRKRS